MATLAQILANHTNAQLSTGPRSEAGKLTSSANAKTHGLTTRQALLPFEDATEYLSHHQDYKNRYLPQSHISEDLVTELADLRWRLQRVPLFEAQVINAEFIKLTTEPEFQPLIKNLESDTQIIALAFARLVDTRILPCLFHQEARLSRRADAIQTRLEQGRTNAQPTPIEPKPSEPIKIGIQKIEPIRVTPQPGRNELCPCHSGLKFKRCCLNKPIAA